MVTVISNDLFNQVDLNSIMEMSTTEYIHVSSKVRKLSVINLGMSTDELHSLKNIKASLNLFGKNFSTKILSSLDTDCCVLTSGELSHQELKQVSENIKPLIGKTQLIGVGIGKEILTSLCTPSNWEHHKDYSINHEFNIITFDNNNDALLTLLG